MSAHKVPCLWPNSTVVIMASGPSLCQEDADFVRGKARVIVVNTTYQIAPWADVLYAADNCWWKWHKGAPDFAGLKYSVTRESARWPGVTILKNTGVDGLELNPTGLRTGKNSGHQAINLAVHLGAVRILLLGYDLSIGPHGKLHWHADHPHAKRSPYSSFLKKYPTLVEPLKQIGVEVINCSTRTALHVFPKRPLREVLKEAAEVAA